VSVRTATHLSSHALDVCREHPKLLVFAALGGLASLALLGVLLWPVYHVVPSDIWRWLHMWEPQSGRDALREFGNQKGWWTLPLPILASLYLFSPVVLGFFDCALCSQCIRALNGGRVSVTRGLATAVAKFPAMAAWALLDHTLGLLVTVIGERLPFVRRLIHRTFGTSWSSAGVFMDPVMVNEPRLRTPFASLRISGRLASRMWGDGVSTMFRTGSVGVGGAVIYFMVFLGVVAAWFTHVYGLLVLAAIPLFFVGIASRCLGEIYLCGLYIYAAEGVLPGPFDDELIRREWMVKPQAAA
jgi:hypothetical protein